MKRSRFQENSPSRPSEYDNTQLDSQGNGIGKDDANPILDSRVYNMEFPYVGVEENSVNTMIENLIEQVD